MLPPHLHISATCSACHDPPSSLCLVGLSLLLSRAHSCCCLLLLLRAGRCCMRRRRCVGRKMLAGLHCCRVHGCCCCCSWQQHPCAGKGELQARRRQQGAPIAGCLGTPIPGAMPTMPNRPMTTPHPRAQPCLCGPAVGARCAAGRWRRPRWQARRTRLFFTSRPQRLGARVGQPDPHVAQAAEGGGVQVRHRRQRLELGCAGG